MTAANNKIRRAPNKRPHPSKGVPLSSERVALIKATTPKGKNHPMWAGDNVGYSGVHIWLTKNYGKASKCMFKNTTFDGKFIKEYKAITHAAKELGILRSSISNALAGVSSMAGGYLWR